MIIHDDPTTIGCHRLGRQLGGGAQGEVYEAYDTRMDRIVALKLLYGGPRSAAEIKACGRLDHPNVVPIYEAGEHEGWPYFTMKLLRGSLAEDEHRRRYITDPELAAQLMETLARAVHYLHQRGILHRDLKPANILLDAAGIPYVADFGVATRIDDDDRGTLAGTRRYMSPEQLDGQASVHCDIYSLGVVLYELLTDRRPFAGADVAALTREIQECTPIDPRRIRPGLDPDLAEICMRCLEKRPEDRHGSAEALAEALRRHLDGELPAGAARHRRMWRWCVHHSVMAGLIAAVLTFVVMMVPITCSLLHEHEATRLAQMTQANMNSAAMVAGTVLVQLRDLGEVVAFSASDPWLETAIRRGDAQMLRLFCEALYRENDIWGGNYPKHNSPFDTWFVLDVKGTLIAQGGKSEVKILGEDYAFRDYFIGARQLAELEARTTYVSKVFRSENDGNYKFALSTPIYDKRGEPIGVLVAAVAAAAHLGSLVIDDPDSTAALVGPRDSERGEAPEAAHVVLLHPEYEYGEGDLLTSAEVDWLDRASRGPERIDDPLGLPPPTRMTASDDYYDSAADDHPVFRGRQIAGFAPVGNTGFVVVVQTPYAELLANEMEFGGRVAAWACVSALPGAALMSFAALSPRRRRRAKLLRRSAPGMRRLPIS